MVLQVRWAHGEGKLKTEKMSEDKAWRMLQALQLAYTVGRAFSRPKPVFQ